MIGIPGKKLFYFLPCKNFNVFHLQCGRAEGSENNRDHRPMHAHHPLSYFASIDSMMSGKCQTVMLAASKNKGWMVERARKRQILKP